MVHDDPKVQAVVDYAGAIGVAMLFGKNGLPSAMAGGYAPHLHGGDVFAKSAASIEIVIGDYKLVIMPSPDISPRAVAERVQRCKELLRALPQRAITEMPPPVNGGSSGGPAPAELRVWPPSAKKSN